MPDGEGLLRVRKSYSKKHEFGQGHSILDLDLGFALYYVNILREDRERQEIRRNTQAKTPSKNTRAYR